MRSLSLLALTIVVALIWGCKTEVSVSSSGEREGTTEASGSSAGAPNNQSNPDTSHQSPEQTSSNTQEEPSPIPLGKPAPDFDVVTLTGEKLKLSSLKGKIVMIDFWATWCPPCREGLPITNKMHEQYAKSGLQVLTISDEDAITVSNFVKENKYTFPTYLDTTGDANGKFKIEGIPTLAVIDAEGNLSSYMVGLHSEEDVVAALKRAGLKT